MQYHTHTGPWWDVTTTEWLQFTDQAVTVADIDGDGMNEVIVAPLIEYGETPAGYPRIAYCVVVYLGTFSSHSLTLTFILTRSLTHIHAPILILIHILIFFI
jgi:hypothetical protein